uniref:Uncharacterized protein n=1 Tax=Spironucleus salmonicida TaxID=348837 RepID=V6LRW4_9EUKA|eukprot:EST47397.1 Hypothetical protein SS50377_12384 [Spironucleus salmonicida]
MGKAVIAKITHPQEIVRNAAVRRALNVFRLHFLVMVNAKIVMIIVKYVLAQKHAQSVQTIFLDDKTKTCSIPCKTTEDYSKLQR